MTNFQIYKKILSFSLFKLLVDFVSLAILIGACVAGFFIANASTSRALIGLVIGFVIGIILAILISVFISNRIKAAQIAMMVKGITEGQLPERSFSEGFKEIKGRFGKITAFFFVTNAIKGIFRQIGQAINKIGTAIGGNVGNGITSAIDSAVQTLLSYLCDCCLAWTFYRKEQNTAIAACEGAVIFFKHGKTLVRNVGRIFGLGAASFLLIGGAFFGISFAIFYQFPGIFQGLANEILEVAARNGGEVPNWITNTTVLTAFITGIGAIVLWSFVHDVFIRPFILVGVMKNFMEAGMKDTPTEKDFAELDARSPRFAKLHRSI